MNSKEIHVCKLPVIFDMHSCQTCHIKNKTDISRKYPAKVFVLRSHWRTIYRSVIINENLTKPQISNNKGDRVLSSLLFGLHHAKRTDQLSVRRQSIYCIKNARNPPSQKHCCQPCCIEKIVWI